MDYNFKLGFAVGLIEAVLKTAKNPAVMCSFGKDSMVLLHLVRKLRVTKVIFHREPFQHHKYAFANKVMRDWDLHMVDFPPMATAMDESDKETHVVNYYTIGGKTIYLPTGMESVDRGPQTLCALDEIYNKPFGAYAYPFDAIFVGHKSVDNDPVLGAIGLNADVNQVSGGASMAYPLRHFTNEDIWRYTEENDLPVHSERYEKTPDGWANRADKTYNPDYMACCYNCMSRKTGNSVHCPKLGFTVSNVSSQLRWAPKLNLTYLNNN